MKCPHCNKEIKVKEDNLKKIINIISKKKKSIAELSKISGISRSTLIYYLNDLKGRNIIREERLMNKLGRPTIISIK